MTWETTLRYHHVVRNIAATRSLVCTPKKQSQVSIIKLGKLEHLLVAGWILARHFLFALQLICWGIVWDAIVLSCMQYMVLRGNYKTFRRR